MRRIASGAAPDASRFFSKSDTGRRPSPLKAAVRRSPRPATVPIGVVVADGHAVMRAGIRALLSADADFTVLAEVHDPRDVTPRVQELKPDILLLDTSLTPHHGFDILHQLQTLDTLVHTILLTSSTERMDIVEALQRGARGIVLRNTPTDLLFRSIRKVQAGEVWIPREAVGDLVAALASVPPAAPPIGQSRDFGLTARERDVLRLIVDGETNKGIATRLAVGPDTVKHHLTSIFNKTGASNRLELALFALHYHLVRPEPD